MSGIRVGIADDNREFCQLLKDYFATQNDLELTVVAHNGVDAIKAISQNQMDVLLLDIIMPQMDGLGVLEWIKEHQPHNRPKIIIFSAFGQEEITKSAINLGVDYYILKPFDLAILTQRIFEIAKCKEDLISSRRIPNTDKDLESQVAQIIQSLKIPSYFKGYSYLKDAILLTINDPNLINEVTKRLYPTIATRYNTTQFRVERAMRFAIETAWNKGDVNVLHELFGYCVDDKKGKPTNASFIAKIADKIRFEKIANQN